jgi:very-short-patch-repair endonuclease
MSRDASRQQRARELRRQITPAESILWREVRNRRFAGFKFRRQHPIGPFFADLACHECKLVVELDGETHLGSEVRDEERAKFLQAQGWMVLRFWNTQVYEELEGVLEVVYRACQERKPQPLTPNPSPLRTGERGENRATSLP